jgi:hypothetical protein
MVKVVHQHVCSNKKNNYFKTEGVLVVIHSVYTKIK